MSYIASPWNHFRAVQAWAADNGVQAHLDLRTFEVDLRAEGRHARLFPQFYVRAEGRTIYAPTLASSEVVGFAGWLPYRPVRWLLSTEKLAFHAFLGRERLLAPAVWPEGATPMEPFVVKRSCGSFGEGMAGPFRTGSTLAPLEPGTFRQTFVQGLNLKVWYWGETPFFAHARPYPQVVGDGASTVHELRDGECPASGDDGDDAAVTAACLAFQGLTVDSVPAADQIVWLDFRYARERQRRPGAAVSDDRLGDLADSLRDQIAHMGRALWSQLGRTFQAPVLYSVDAVSDAKGVWWLEANSNPVLPPEGYRLVLGTLFAVSSQVRQAA